MPPELQSECLDGGELERLLQGRLTASRLAWATDHIGQCPDCQQRLEALIADGAPLAEALRRVSELIPPRHSAYHRAVAALREELRATTLLPQPTPEEAADAGIAAIDLSFLMPAAEPDLLGQLGPFRVRRVLGRGGMGIVMQAYDPDLDREVAIKIIEPYWAGNEVARQRFCREARAAAAVTHEHIVTVFQVAEDEHSGLPYLVMQLVQGESLEQRLRREGRLPPLVAARIGMQAAAGLAAAHAAGLVHRDIKPANILLEVPHDRVKLTDFGLARAVEDVKLTRSGMVAGSPLYMSPEQARGEEVDFRSDLFSLGAVLYEAISGQPPFAATTPLAVLRRITDEEPLPLRQAAPDVPPEVAAIVDRLLVKDPAGRFGSAAEVAAAFATVLARHRQLTPLEIPAGVCVESDCFAVPAAIPRWRQRLRRLVDGNRWRRLARPALPWLGGALLGAAAGSLLTAWTLPPRIVERTIEVPAARTAGPEPHILLADTQSGAIWSLAFVGNDRLLVGSENGTLRLWDLKRAAAGGDGLLKTFEPQQNGNIWNIDVSADGKYAVSACDDSAVVLWNLHTLRFEGLKFPHPHSARSAAFSPDHRYLATGDRNSTIRIWDMGTQVPVELREHRGTVHGLVFSPDGRWLASCGSDRMVHLWDVTTIRWADREGPERILSLSEHRGPVYAVAFSPEGDRLASCGWDGTVRLWDTANGTQLLSIKAHDGDAWAVSFGGGGRWLASCGSDGAVRVWDTNNGQEVFAWRGDRGMHIVRFAPDGTTLAAAGRDGIVRVWTIPPPADE